MGENGGRREERARFIPNSQHVIGGLISCFGAAADMKFIRVVIRCRIHRILVTVPRDKFTWYFDEPWGMIGKVSFELH